MSWEAVRLDKVCIFLNGGTPSRQVDKFFEGNIPWITSADISEDQDIVSEARFYITQEAVDSSATKLIPKGNILLVSRTGVGKIAITGTDICISQDFTGIIPNKEVVNLRYLFRFLQSKKDYFVSHQRGATIQGITRKVISDLEIPLPPLEEQRHIAAILDQADRLRTLRREALAKLDRLLQATFLDMFGDPVTNPLGWEIGMVGDLSEKVNYGTSKKADPNKGEFPILRMGNITYEGHWDFSDLKYIDFDESEQQKYLVHKGQILFNRTNSKELVGKTAVYREDKPLAFAGYLIRIQTNKRANPEYVGAYMNTDYIKQFLQEKCKSIIGMANINARELQAISIPIPPIDLQNKFAKIVEHVLNLRQIHEANLSQLDNLFNSLQQRAFRGELSERSVV